MLDNEEVVKWLRRLADMIESENAEVVSAACKITRDLIDVSSANTPGVQEYFPGREHWEISAKVRSGKLGIG